MSQMKKTTNVKVGAGNSVPINLSRNHYTTLGFGSVFPAYNLECIPGDKITIRPELFARVAPMVLPPFANVDVKLTAFFVPFRNVWSHWNNFLGGLPVSDGQGMRTLTSVPVISRETLIALFSDNTTKWSTDRNELSSLDNVKSAFSMFASWKSPSGDPRRTYSLNDSLKAAGIGSVDTYDPATDGTSRMPVDFIIQGEDTDHYYMYQFTKQGKRVLQILHSLGYNFNFFTPTTEDNKPEYYSALPLLCFFKAFVDWHMPSQLQNSSSLHTLLEKVSRYMPADGSLAGMQLYYADLLSMFQSIVDYYDNDYFTSAWLYANSPADGLNNYGNTANPDSSAITTNNVSQLIDSDSTRDSNPLVTSDNWSTRAETPNSLSYDGLTLLQRFANFVRRNNFAGSRAVERILARFGVRVPDAVVDYSDFIGSWTTPLNITDVTSQGSDLANLGDYAGKGYIASQGSPTWTYEVQQHGMLFVFAAVQTHTTYLEGVRRELYHLSPLDYYTPEFDGTLMQAIAGSELQGKFTFDLRTARNTVDLMKLTSYDIYGFIQRYAEYKRSLDDISGDFDINRFRTSLSSFLFTRNLLVQNNEGNNYSLARTDGLSRGEEFTPIDALSYSDGSQYNHIFKDSTGAADPFFCQFHFEVTAHRRMLAPNDTAELFGRGNSVEMNTNGARV